MSTRSDIEYLAARARESHALWAYDVAARDAAIYAAEQAGIPGRTLAVWAGLTSAMVCKVIANQARRTSARPQPGGSTP